MRVGLDNGNGAMCDVCHTLLYPDEVLKIKVDAPHTDRKKRSMGARTVVSKMDICENCLDNLLGKYLREPRK